MAGELLNLDIKDFTQVSSVALGDYVLLVRANGMNGKIGIELFKTSVVADIKPSIRDGNWWIGEVAQNVKAIGQTPIIRKGELGLEWKYQDEDDSQWRLIVEYTDLIFTFDDLSPEQKDTLKLHFEDLTPEDIAVLQQPAAEATEAANTAAAAANSAAENATSAASLANTSAQEATAAKEDTVKATQAANAAAQNANNAADRVTEAILDISEEKQLAVQAAQTANTAAQNADNSREAIEQNEAERQTNEQARQEAEAQRVQNENSRKAAETARVQAESSRVEAEQGRVTEFNAKIEETNTANSNFAKAEATRQTQESTRQQNTATAIQNVNTARAACEEATQECEEVIASISGMGRLGLLVTSMKVEYPRVVPMGDNDAYINAILTPEEIYGNVLYLSDNNAVQVEPNGKINTLKTGESTVHVIPTCHVRLYQTIKIKVVEPVIYKASDGNIRLMGNGGIRKINYLK